MDFDPHYPGNLTFLNHSSQGNFDQHWIAIPKVYRLTWKKTFCSRKSADVSTHVTVQSVSAKKIVSCDIMKFLKFHAFITNWSINMIRVLTSRQIWLEMNQSTRRVLHAFTSSSENKSICNDHYVLQLNNVSLKERFFVYTRLLSCW